MNPPPSSAREIVSRRVVDAPRDLVFAAYTDPVHLALWWGPKGFKNTFQEFDLRPGGAWRFVMHGPNGADYYNESEFAEIVSPHRIVFRHLSPPFFECTITLEERGEKTGITFRMLFETEEECARISKIAVPANEENFDRLEAELARMEAARSGVAPFTISRVFEASRDVVFRCWTEHERMNWFGPKGISLVHRELDLRPGGRFLYCMRTPEGKEMWGRWILREIVPPERLVFTNSFSDAHGGITRHPLSDTWPLELLSTVTFEEEGADRTRVTVEWQPLHPTDEERKTFDEGRASMEGGWSGTFERLADYLAEHL